MSLEPRPEGTLLVGKFRVLRELGRGAMGIVYEVRHELTKHRRALKTLDPETMSAPDAVDRFMREASAAGRIGNAHVVETFDAGILETGEPYLVMELLAGETLADRLEKRGPMSLEEIGELFQQACEGIQAAHDAGIVHRDLKPENLFITSSDGQPFLKILDFGISKFTTVLDSSTRTGTTIGTPGYMSPEQVRGQTLDGRSDLYSLGVILYECVTGEHPYPAEAPTAMVANVLEVDPPPVSTRRADAPPQLDALVARALQKDREARFSSATELGAALRAALEGRTARLEEDEAAAMSALPLMPTALVSTVPGRATTDKGGGRGGIALAAVVTFCLIAGVVLWRSGAFDRDPDPAPDSSREAAAVASGAPEVGLAASSTAATASTDATDASSAPSATAAPAVATSAAAPLTASGPIPNAAPPPPPGPPAAPVKPADDLATKGEFKP